MKKIVALSILLLSFSSMAAELRKVTCRTVTDSNTYAKKTHTITLKLDQENNIVKWSEYFVAKADPQDNIFGLFGQSLEDSAVSSVHMAKSKNGYSIVTLETSIGAFKVGVYKNGKTGFYNYIDNGYGGNGNINLSLTCGSR